MEDQAQHELFHNRYAADAAGSGPMRAEETRFRQPGARVMLHGERQNTASAGWRRLLQLVDEAAADGREVFRPLVELTTAERADLVTLPPTIAKLVRVRHLALYGSPLVRIPPQIGAMASLEIFEPCTSYSLHWFPYELARCVSLRSSTVSTRALYGKVKSRPPFPRLHPRGAMAALPAPDDLDPREWGVESIHAGSVCDGPIAPARFRQVWISLRVATDVLPLLVNACSTPCVQALPQPPEGHVGIAHHGGLGVRQPKPAW